MQSTIQELAKLADAAPPAFTSFDAKSVPLPRDQEIHPTVVDYFASCVPEESLGFWIYSLLSPADLVAENDHRTLGDAICRSGFVIFGRLDSGDYMAVDVVSGRCIELASFAAYEPDDDLRAQLFAYAQREYDSLAEFFVTCQREFSARTERDARAGAAFEKSADVDPNARDPEGNTRLALRILEEDLAGVRHEVERGASLVPLSEDDDDPMEDSITLCESTAILEYLIEKGAPVKPQALVWAAEAMAYDHLDVLLAAGANPEALPAADREELMEDEAVVERLERFLGRPST